MFCYNKINITTNRNDYNYIYMFVFYTFLFCMFIRQIHVLLFATYFERIYAQLSQLCENELKNDSTAKCACLGRSSVGQQ